MEIELSSIQPSPQPVRTSWDEAKMAELIESIKERGVIAPIKVRPLFKGCPWHGLEWFEANSDRVDELVNCMGCNDMLSAITPEDEDEARPTYEIIYGHRRFEACRRLRMVEIPVIVGEMEPDDALIEQIIENELREDLPYLEKAQSFERAMARTGWTQTQLSRRTGIPQQTLSNAIQWLASMREGAAVRITRSSNLPAVESTLAIKRALGTDIEGRRSVAAKVEQEELDHWDARKVADTYKAAEDKAERQAILDTPFRDPSFERLVKVKAHVRRESAREQERKRQEESREVRVYLDALRTFRAACQEAAAVAKFGKFSPEASRFVREQHAKLRDDLHNLERELEVYYAEN